MYLYLVQHAEAKKEEEDPSRPLSERGLKEITRTASFVSRLGIHVERIVHSKKLRAEQTAKILFETIKDVRHISQEEGLAPLDDPGIWSEKLDTVTDDMLLVGHLPHLASLASLLLCGDTMRPVIAFRMAGVVCLERDEKSSWSVRWMVTPDMVD